ncbi:MAG: response regulator transcription factor [Flavobacteriales bacterium]|nr:response regulator transcription factor [Flavobacteriales bacterium]
MSGKINAIIVDDEPFARENLAMMVNDFCPEVRILDMASGAAEARRMVEELNPDLVFLDIMMPGEDGFSFLQHIPDRTFQVIFTTAHNEFALRAIKQSAIDYIEKPINIDDLQHAVSKAARQIELSKKAPFNEDKIGKILAEIALNNSVEKTSIPTRDGMAIVKNSEIIHLEASESYTTIYLTGNRKYLSSKTIKVYEDKLDGNMFFRTHKSHIINISHHLKEFRRAEGNVAIMSNDVEIPISRRKLPSFLDRLAAM